ncbi:hypothetical protein Golax_016580, partial [Gossypium laxum]|nr:hypothetical protein [Gossypium laxum]
GCGCKFVLSVCRVLYCFVKLLAKGSILFDWFCRFSVLLEMDEALQRLSFHEKKDVELVLDRDVRVGD